MQIVRNPKLALAIIIGCLLPTGSGAQEIPANFGPGRAIFACANLAVMKGDMEAAGRLATLGYETLKPVVAARWLDPNFPAGWPYLVQFSDDFLIGTFWGMEAMQMAVLMGHDYRPEDVEAEYFRRNCAMLQ